MTVVAKFSELESGTAHKVMVDGVPVAVVRIEDEVFAIADTCSHADISLSLGMVWCETCLLYTSPSPRDRQKSRMPSSA